MTVGGQADKVFCFNRPCECHLYTAPRNKYGLIGEEKTVDPRTATIKKPLPAPNGNGKGRNETLLTALAQEAADSRN